MESKSILVYGFGNPGRQDDGLGPAIIERLENEGIPGVVTDCNYQLNIEDAYSVAENDVVVFVDASLDADEPFSFSRIEASAEITFTTHSMSPQSVLALCAELYDRKLEAFVLGIKGYEWDFEVGLTSKAENNFNEAYTFLKNWLNDMLAVKRTNN